MSTRGVKNSWPFAPQVRINPRGVCDRVWYYSGVSYNSQRRGEYSSVAVSGVGSFHGRCTPDSKNIIFGKKKFLLEKVRP